MLPRVAVVGCGPCGMSIFSAFDEAKQKGENVPKLTCFEKQAETRWTLEFYLEDRSRRVW